MSGLRIEIDTSDFKQLIRKFDELERRIPQAIALGLNDGGKQVRTQVQQTLKKQTGVRAYSSITSRIRTEYAAGGAARSGIGPAGPSALTFAIVAKGPGIPISEFRPKLTLRGVRVDVWGVERVFERSFGVKGGGPGTFRARRGPDHYPIRKLYGPNVAKELSKGAVPSTFYLASAAFVGPAIVKQLRRVL